MSGHLARVQDLLARGDVEGAKTAHNAGVVRVRNRARKGGSAFQRLLPELRRAKAELEAAEKQKRRM